MMWIRTSAITFAMLLLLGVSGDRAKCVRRAGSSAQSFQHYFQALKQTPLNPLERIVYSLVLANTNEKTLNGGT